MSSFKKKVLAVDDVPENLHILTAILKDTYAIIVALNGEKAIELARKHRPDIILLDALMPGMDGFETCKNLRSNAETSGIPVIFISSTKSEEDVERSKKLGAVEFIQKPILPDSLKETIRAYTRGDKSTI